MPRLSMLLALLLAPLGARAADAPPGPPALDAAAAGRFAELALACVHREYPNKVSHVLQGDADARPPRALTPALESASGPAMVP